MNGVRHALASGIVIAMLTAACADGDRLGNPPGATVTEPSTGETTMGEIEPGLGALVDMAVADLATRLDVPPNEIEVLAARSVVWPDSSLGCPHPDMRYQQVPQDGAQIELRHAGQAYSYHTGGNRSEPFLCEQAARKGVPPPGGDIDT